MNGGKYEQSCLKAIFHWSFIEEQNNNIFEATIYQVVLAYSFQYESFYSRYHGTKHNSVQF